MLSKALGLATLLLTAGVFFLWSMLSSANDKLDIANDTIKAQGNIFVAVERIEAVQQRVDRAANRAIHAIQEAPNADQPISPDVAIAWRAGIDSVRDAASSSSADKLRRSDARSTRSRGTDRGTTGGVLKSARGGTGEVQHSLGRTDQSHKE